MTITEQPSFTQRRTLTNPYLLRIYRALARRSMRFRELERAIDAPNPPLLSSLLKRAQRDGTVHRHVVTLGPPPHVIYSLTSLGSELAKPATDLVGIVEGHRSEIEASREAYRGAPKGNDPVLIADRVNTGRCDP
jgi:DNA-binding HxlR family transcriptional regulator